MSVLSVPFLLFLIILIGFYYLLPAKCAPYVILAGNIYFYLQFDWRYSIFLLLSILCTFFGGWWIEKAEGVTRKIALATVLTLNIGCLFTVKFVPWLSGIADTVLKTDFSDLTSKFLIPLGISFYTLQLCGYCIDVYRKKYPATAHFFKYASFATFFPLMLQGPISRYDQLGEQLFQKAPKKEFYENLTSGAQLMLWGFFKKLVLADRAAIAVNLVFQSPEEYSGITVAIAALCYTLQIYADFSGCVDICRGAARIFGIDVIENFRQPYFAVSVQDFWRRWHIALSSWLRDYVYFSLGGNRKGTVRKHVNLFIVFIVSGLWHGVGINFLVWGGLQAFFQISGALLLPLREKCCALLHINRNASPYLWFRRLFTLGLVTLSWVFFRANGTMATVKMIGSLFTTSHADFFPGLDLLDVGILAVGVLVLFFVSYYREKNISVAKAVGNCVLPARWAIYLALFLIVLIFGVYGPGYSASSFIYMNF